MARRLHKPRKSPDRSPPDNGAESPDGAGDDEEILDFRRVMDEVDDLAWRSSPPATAAYIRDMADGLTRIAEQSGLSTLAYLLSVAAEEARARAGQSD